MHCNDWGMAIPLPPFWLYPLPGTAPWNAGPGFTEFAAQEWFGYDFGSDWGPAYGDSYGLIMEQIDACQPLMIMFGWGGSYEHDWHWCVIRGYKQDTSGSHIYLNDPLGQEGWVNWGENWASVALTWIWPNL